MNGWMDGWAGWVEVLVEGWLDGETGGHFGGGTGGEMYGHLGWWRDGWMVE